MSRFIRVAVVLCLALTAQAEAQGLTAADAVRLALEKGPRLIGARAELRAAEARQEQAALLFQANPEFQGALGPRFGSTPGSIDSTAGVSQELELFGQKGARRSIAAAELDVSRARLASEQLTLSRDVRVAFARVLGAQQERQVAQEALALARDALAASEARFKAGAATQIEVNTARVELGRAVQEGARQLREAGRAMAELQLLLGVDAGSNLQLIGQLTASAPGTTVDDASAIEVALRRRPELASLRAAFEAARSELTAADREALPRPRVGVSYSREEAAQIVQGTLGFSLPLFNRNPGGRGTASARLDAAQQELAAAERTVTAEVRLATARLRAARETASAYGADVAQALQQNLSLVTEGYQAGKIDFLQLLIIRRETLDGRRGYIAALEELAAAEAEFARATGESP